MEEFLKFLQEMMKEGMNTIQGVVVGDILYAIGLDENTPEEVREGFKEKAAEEGHKGEIRELKYPCATLQEDKEPFNEGLNEIFEKYDISPKAFGLDYGTFGFTFVFKEACEQYPSVRDDLVDIVNKLRLPQRAIFVHKGKQQVFETDGRGNSKEIFASEETPAKKVFRTEPVNRKPISDSEVLDLKIVLNQDDKRDCLEVLEDLMKIGG